MIMEDCLELTDTQFKRLPVTQKLDVLYMNVRTIAGIKRKQNMQWLSLGALGSAIGWLFLELWKIKGAN
jgi:hypothetical protein